MSCFMLSRRGGGGFSSRAFSSGRGFGRSPAIDLDFTKGVMPARVVHSRASNATQFNAAGTLVNAPHNLLTNSVIDGGTSGVLGAGAVNATGWGIPQYISGSSGAGNTTTFAFGSENGIPYLDLGINVVTALGSAQPILLTLPGITPTVGLTYTAAADFKLSSGTLPGGLTLSLINWWQSVSQPLTSLSGITGTIQRYTQTSVVPASTTSGVMAVQMSLPTGSTYSFSVRIYRPQLEQNLAASIYTPTTTAAVYGARLDYDPSTLISRGLLVEAAGTNYMRSSVLPGATVGQIYPTSVGTMPTDFSYLSADAGGTLTVMGSGIENGLNYVELRFQNASGTSTGGTWRIYSNSLATAAINQPWVASMYHRLVSGSTANTSSHLQVVEKVSGGGHTNFSDTYFTPVPAITRINSPRVLTGATTNGLALEYELTGTSGQAYDVTIRIYGIQLEAGYAPTSFIATNGSSVTRAADIAYVPVAGIKGINGNTGSLFAQMIYEAPNSVTGGTYARWFAFNNNAAPDEGTEWGVGFGLAYPSTGASFIAKQSAGTSGGNSITNATANMQFRITSTFSLQVGVLSHAANTTSVLNLAINDTVVPRTLDRLNISQRQRYQNPASLWFQRIIYYPAYLGPTWATNKANGTIP